MYAARRARRTAQANRARRDARRARFDRQRTRASNVTCAALLAPLGSVLCWFAALCLSVGTDADPFVFAVAVVALGGMGVAAVLAAALFVFAARP